MTVKVKAPDVAGYVPPKGWIVVKTIQLPDGSYELTLEPEELPSAHSGGAGSLPVPLARIVRLVARVKSRAKGGPTE